MGSENKTTLLDLEENNLNGPKRPSKWAVVLLIVAAVLMVLAIVVTCLNAFVFLRVKIEGSSMEGTLLDGQTLLVNTRVQADYGDVVVIDGEIDDDASGARWIVKRAIAFGGDTVKIEGGYVFLKRGGQDQFTQLDESGYLKENGKTFYPDHTDEADVAPWEYVVPDGEVFYLGDNRMHSSDSRYNMFGTCKLSQIKGVVCLWSRSLSGYFSFVEKVFGNA